MEIEVLRGAERVRRRPAVLFGSDDIEGVKNMWEDLLDIFLQEHHRGYGDRLIVTRHTDGALEIQYNGRGLYLENAWEELFCTLFAASLDDAPVRSAFDVPYKEGQDVLESLSLCAGQYASAYMDVRVVRDGVCTQLHFKEGEPVGEPEVKNVSAPGGTVIRFKPDPKVFTETELSAETIAHKLHIAALCYPDLTIQLLPENKVFHYPQGLCAALEQKPAYSRSIQAEGRERYNKKEYKAEIRVALGFAQQGFVTAIHGGRELAHGGTHVDAIVEKLAQYINWDLPGKISKKRLLQHLQLVVYTRSEVTCWVNGARMAIENKLLRDMAEDTIDEAFRTYLHENKETIKKLLKD